MSDENMSFEDAEGSLTVDLSEIEEDSGFETIPRGAYDVIVAECEFTYSQTSGNPMWSIILEVENNEQYNGRKLFTFCIFSEKMMGRAKKTLNILGLSNLLEGPFNPADDNIVDQVIGKTAVAIVKVTKGEDGDDRNEVKQLKARGGAGDSFGGL